MEILMKEEVRLNIEKALKLRKEQDLTYSEIAKELNRPIGTIKRWLSPYKIERTVKLKEKHKENIRKSSIKSSLKRQEKYASLRNDAYQDAKQSAEIDLKNTIVRDFVNLYVGEGAKKEKNRIQIVNSDPKVILISLAIMKKYFLKENKKITLEVKYYENNNNEQELLEYWKKVTNNDPSIIYKTYIQPTNKPFEHNNSNKFGLLSVRVYDTYAKQKLNAYMDYLKEEWVKEFEKTFNVKFDHSITEIKANK